MLPRWLRRWPFRASSSQVRNVRQSLDLPQERVDLATLFPLLVPDSFFISGTWGGPIERLRTPTAGLTWGLEQPDRTLRYLDRGLAAFWSSRGIDWRQEALANLRRRSRTALWTHQLRRGGGPVFAAFLMHDDGFGPSRLLLEAELAAAFPAGYRVALPQLSCGLALARDATPEEMDAVRQVLARWFAGGADPRAELLEPRELTVAPGAAAGLREAG
jgi:hypothetical protein